MGEACSTYGGAGEVHKVFWLGDLKDRDRLENLGVDVRIILRWMTKQWDGEAWIGLIWMRIGTGSELLCMR